MVKCMTKLIKIYLIRFNTFAPPLTFEPLLTFEKISSYEILFTLYRFVYFE